jgi:hypothetical protein
VNLHNFLHPVRELPLPDGLARRLCGAEIRTVGKLEQQFSTLSNMGFSDKALQKIHTALQEYHNFVADLASVLIAEGLSDKVLRGLWPFDLLSLPLTCAQLGYILRWQLDVGGRYGEQERFCVADGKIYYCTTCPYRDERSHFCGFCTKKLLEEIEEKRRENREPSNMMKTNDRRA